MEVVARPGKQNQSADALSRIDNMNVIRVVDIPVGHNSQQQQRNNLQEAQRSEPKLEAIIKFLSQDILPEDTKQAEWTLKVAPYYEMVEQILYRKANTFQYARRQERKLRIVLPQKLRAIILEECHDTSASGHLGIKRTLARIEENYFWAGMYEDVRKYVTEDYRHYLTNNMKQIWDEVLYYNSVIKQQREVAAEKDRIPPNFHIGDLVWLYTQQKKKGLSLKLMHLWHGPYQIVELTSPVNVKLQTMNSKKMKQIVHVSRL